MYGITGGSSSFNARSLLSRSRFWRTTDAPNMASHHCRELGVWLGGLDENEVGSDDDDIGVKKLTWIRGSTGKASPSFLIVAEFSFTPLPLPPSPSPPSSDCCLCQRSLKITSLILNPKCLRVGLSEDITDLTLCAFHKYTWLDSFLSDFIDETLVDEATNSIPFDDVNRVTKTMWQFVTDTSDRIWKQCKWRHLVAKFATNASVATWWPNLHPIQVATLSEQICNQWGNLSNKLNN